MAAHLLDFLKNKFINELNVPKESSFLSKVPCPELLIEISEKLKETSFKHDKIHEAIDLLYDLNNLLEDCMMFEETTSGDTGRKSRYFSLRGIRRECDATKNKCCYARKTQAELNKFLERLAELQPTEKSPPDVAEASSISVIRREGFPYFVKSEVCWFDGPLDDFKDFIRKNQHNVAMAFVGIGGSGKSTLARMIFLDEEVQKEFDNVVLWVDCSEVSDPNTKLSCITVEKFRHTASPCRYTLEEALRSLHGIIRDRRCLVVLDGLWISDGTKTFVDVVTRQLRGTIIITTRLNDVAEALVEEKNIFSSDKFWTLQSEGAKKEEGRGEEKVGAGAKKEEKAGAGAKEEEGSEEENPGEGAKEEEKAGAGAKKEEASGEEEVGAGAKKEEENEMLTQEYCWSVFEETLKRKRFGDMGGIELHKDIRIAELADVIKRGSLGNPLAAKTLAEVISQRLHKTGYWAEEKKTDSGYEPRVENWEFRLKVDVYDHLTLSKAWYKVLSTEDVVKEKSYYHKNELIVTSKCHPRDVLRSLRDVCHVEFISIVHTRTTSPSHN